MSCFSDTFLCRWNDLLYSFHFCNIIEVTKGPYLSESVLSVVVIVLLSDVVTILSGATSLLQRPFGSTYKVNFLVLTCDK